MIVDVNGRPLNGKTPPALQTPELASLRQRFDGHPAHDLTPARLKALLRSAEFGALWAQHELFTDMEETDAHIFSELSKRRRALLRLDWDLHKAPSSSDKHVDACRQLLGGIEDFEDLVFDLTDAVGHGWVCLEIEWQREGREWLPAKCHHRPHTWFQTAPENRNELRLADGSREGAELVPFGWVVHRHQARSGYLARSALYRVLVWPYLYRHWSVEDFASYLEIHGLPARVGYYPPGANDEAKAVLLEAVRSLGHDAAGIMPEGMQIEFKQAADGSERPFESMRDWSEKSISKAILGGTLTSQADGRTSTNALGNVHNEVRHDLKESDANQVAGTIRRYLLFPYLALNYGVSDLREVPRFLFDTREPADLAQLARALPPLVAVGMQVPLAWAHEKARIPLPKDDEPVLTAPRQSAPLPPDSDAAARAVLTNSVQAAGDIADQTALDEALASLAPETLQRQAMEALRPILDMLQQADDAEAALGALAELYPQMTSVELERTLANLLFAADTWGRLSANAEL